MAGTDPLLTQYRYALKEFYTGQEIEDTTLKGKPLLDLITKDTSFQGDTMPLPIIYGGSEGFGTTLSGAQSNRDPTSGLRFQIEVGNTYTTVVVEDKIIEASRGNPGAFMRNQKVEIDSKLDRFGQVLSVQLFGNGGGSLGQFASVSGSPPAASVYTLVNKMDIVHFYEGMKIVASANDGSAVGHALLNSGGTPYVLTVTAVQPEAGTFTATGEITGLTANHYFFRADMFSGAVTQTSLWKGLQAWVPASAPTSTLFFQVNRTVHTSLGGYRLASPSGTIMRRLKDMHIKGNTLAGGMPTLDVIHPLQWDALESSMQNTGVRVIELKNSTGNFGYSALTYKSPHGDVSILADSHCPLNTAWGLNLKYIKIWSMREMVHMMNGDGNESLREASGSGYETRFVSYGQVAINKPCEFFRTELPAITL